MSQIKVELQESMGGDRAIADAAWTSSSEHQKKKFKTIDQVKDLINRLADDKHATPFESVVFKFWIKLPIQTDRQHMTHRIASHNGMSGRYRTMPSEYLDVPVDIEEIIYKFKCLSGDVNNPTELDLFYHYYQLCESANTIYSIAIDNAKKAEKAQLITNKEFKRFREFYRGVLPQNNMTERVTIMNLRSFANYQKLRNTEHAQPEIRQIAQLMLESVVSVCPIAIEALKRNNWII